MRRIRTSQSPRGLGRCVGTAAASPAISGECGQQQVDRSTLDCDPPSLTALRRYLGSVVLLGYVQPTEMGGESVGAVLDAGGGVHRVHRRLRLASGTLIHRCTERIGKSGSSSACRTQNRRPPPLRPWMPCRTRPPTPRTRSANGWPSPSERCCWRRSCGRTPPGEGARKPAVSEQRVTSGIGAAAKPGKVSGRPASGAIGKSG